MELQASPQVERPPAEPKADPNAPVETEILATKGANFISKDRIAVFEGDVRVNDPRFQLACDKLTVYLAKGVGEGGAGTPAATPPPANSPGGSGGGGIDHVVARGNVIIIQKRPPAKPGEEPKISMGRAEWAEYDSKTGDMTLHGTPSIEQNGNTHRALSPETIIILHKDNSMDTVGPSRTVLKQAKGGNSMDLPGSTPPAGNAPAKVRRRDRVKPNP